MFVVEIEFTSPGAASTQTVAKFATRQAAEDYTSTNSIDPAVGRFIITNQVNTETAEQLLTSP